MHVCVCVSVCVGMFGYNPYMPPGGAPGAPGMPPMDPQQMLAYSQQYMQSMQQMAGVWVTQHTQTHTLAHTGRHCLLTACRADGPHGGMPSLWRALHAFGSSVCVWRSVCICIWVHVCVCVQRRSRVARCSWVRSRGPAVSASAVDSAGRVLVWTDELLGFTY